MKNPAKCCTGRGSCITLSTTTIDRLQYIAECFKMKHPPVSSVTKSNTPAEMGFTTASAVVKSPGRPVLSVKMRCQVSEIRPSREKHSLFGEVVRSELNRSRTKGFNQLSAITRTAERAVRNRPYQVTGLNDKYSQMKGVGYERN